MTHTVYIGLGANLGDRQANIDAALAVLRSHVSVQSVQCSSVIETAPVGGPADQPDYLNAVARVETTQTPTELLELLLSVEHELGRERREKWGPRLIDLDILLYDDAVVDEPDLRIPHPHMHDRLFVLKPLCELAPGQRHPQLDRTFSELLTACELAEDES